MNQAATGQSRVHWTSITLTGPAWRITWLASGWQWLAAGPSQIWASSTRMAVAGGPPMTLALGLVPDDIRSLSVGGRLRVEPVEPGRPDGDRRAVGGEQPDPFGRVEGRGQAGGIPGEPELPAPQIQ